MSALVNLLSLCGTKCRDKVSLTVLQGLRAYIDRHNYLKRIGTHEYKRRLRDESINSLPEVPCPVDFNFDSDMAGPNVDDANDTNHGVPKAADLQDDSDDAMLGLLSTPSLQPRSEPIMAIPGRRAASTPFLEEHVREVDRAISRAMAPPNQVNAELYHAYEQVKDGLCKHVKFYVYDKNLKLPVVFVAEVDSKTITIADFPTIRGLFCFGLSGYYVYHLPRQEFVHYTNWMHPFKALHNMAFILRTPSAWQCLNLQEIVQDAIHINAGKPGAQQAPALSTPASSSSLTSSSSQSACHIIFKAAKCSRGEAYGPIGGLRISPCNGVLSSDELPSSSPTCVSSSSPVLREKGKGHVDPGGACIYPTSEWQLVYVRMNDDGSAEFRSVSGRFSSPITILD
ncbi:hypothetical protein M422DRAFT_52431 [Sphaerobolus stellatus SS14]|uniref:Unplaced genomic scaffold SPHSTscaffold_137, whole genome shotgun sequence n=1 Tax=Sphaerobolus stellatus (strain SS14) TaxID=990650 RepID=A0A0C9TTA5_SPHS4|nr:hypothetical protein M422DRAFT_52431 [Sphaerobolus stellatus SS14]